ncbi:MAG TPA: hypothetical protein VF818_10010, partial [Ktedonobacterales bacterium]
MLLTHAVQMFLTAKDYTPRSAEWYATTLSAFAAWLEREHAVQDVEAIRNLHVRDYFTALRTAPTPATGQPLASATAHNRAAAIIAWLHWLQAEDVAHPQTLKNVKKPVVETKVKGTLAPEHIAALFRAAKLDTNSLRCARDTALLSLLLDTGARANEVVTLRQRDITMT